MEHVNAGDVLRARLHEHRAAGRRVAFVPTMGALHEGHLALVRRASAHAGVVVVSLFVNPTQFDSADDLAAYPRDTAADLAALARLGPATPDLVFLPEAAEVYPPGAATRVQVLGLTDGLCGASRPGHFDGVATVVTTLLNLVRPDVAVFGRKDFQQLQVVRRLVRDLALGVEVVAAPTVREPRDGLALSSRNRRLSPAGRAAAAAIPAALRAAVVAGRRPGGPIPGAVHAAVLATLRAQHGLEIDYVAVVDPDTLQPVADDRRRADLLVAVAVRIGAVRLIDNVEIGDEDDERGLLEATG